MGRHGPPPPARPATGGGDADEATCAVRVTTMPVDESLGRIVGLLLRTRWSVSELHHRSGAERHEVQLRATKPGGRADLLVAQLQREVTVVDVVSLVATGDSCDPSSPSGRPPAPRTGSAATTT